MIINNFSVVVTGIMSLSFANQAAPADAFLREEGLTESVFDLPLKVSQALASKREFLEERRRLQGLRGICDSVLQVLDAVTPSASDSRQCSCNIWRQELTCEYEAVPCQGKILPSYTMNFNLGNPTTVDICQEFAEDMFDPVCVEAELVRLKYDTCTKATYGGKTCDCMVCEDGVTIDVDCSEHHPLATTNGCQRMFVLDTCLDFLPIVLEEDHQEEINVAASLPANEATGGPSVVPSTAPTHRPTARPSWQPTDTPTLAPSLLPTYQPSNEPTQQPSDSPSSHPSFEPSVVPTKQPSIIPTISPSTVPSDTPSDIPSSVPSEETTYTPSSPPSKEPSRQLPEGPSEGPSRQPSGAPVDDSSLAIVAPQLRAREWAQEDPNLLVYSFARSIQRYALAVLYYSSSTSVTGWKQSNNWLSYEASECRWYSGASSPCSPSGDFEILDLADNGLVGSIVPEIGRLVGLTTLDLSSNQLSGELPSEIGRLNNLEMLSLSYNSLSGSIPSELGMLTNAASIELYHNNFEGQIPQEVCDLIRLHDTLVHVDCDAVFCACGCMCF